MKVTCESCGSKYTIKDEKVRGKRVKIRCKGCKSPIVVDGTLLDGSAASAVDSVPAPATTEPPEAMGMDSAPAPAPAAPAGDMGESWSVNLSETDSRDMTTQEIVAAWGTLVTDDAYVYKPGFDDWKPILEVPELASLLPSAAVQDAFSPPAGQSPFAAAGGSSSVRGADLFGNVASAGSEEDQSFAPPPPMPTGDSKPTGARNESSVLFSLDALKAGFEGQGSAPAPAPAASNNDPFGLGAAAGFSSLGGGFDQNQALFAPPPPEPKKPKKISLVPAAVEGEEAPNRGKLMMMVAGALALVVAVGGVGYALGGSSSDDKEVASAEAESSELSGKVREGKLKQDSSAANKDSDKDKAQDKSDAKQDEEKSDEDKADKDKSDDKAEDKADDKADKADKAETAGKAADTKATDTKSTSTKSDPKAAVKDTKKDAPKDDGGGAPPFNKGAAISALSSAAGSAAGCKIPGGPTGRGKAVVTFAPSGRVTTANVVGGSFGGTSVGGCVASRFRRARVPAFSGGPVTVSKSFSIQ